MLLNYQLFCPIQYNAQQMVDFFHILRQVYQYYLQSFHQIALNLAQFRLKPLIYLKT